jgi:hypothetical protein
MWLRGRLLGLRLRRLFGGRPAIDHGPDFHLADSEVPVEGVDYEPIELPAELAARLDMTRAELLRYGRDASRRRTHPARPRRTVAVAAAAVLGLGVVGAGASALVAGTTGVPAVDRLLGVYEQNLDKPGTSDRPGASGGDLQPRSFKAADPIETTSPDGTRSVTTFYVARDGRICWAVVDGDGSGSGTVSCERPRDVASGIDDGGYVPGLETDGRRAILRGYVGGDVTSLSGRGPDGPLDVQLGRSWKPSAPGLGTLKPFVAVGRVDPRTSPGSSGMPGALMLRNYTFEAETDDGRRISIAP